MCVNHLKFSTASEVYQPHEAPIWPLDPQGFEGNHSTKPFPGNHPHFSCWETLRMDFFFSTNFYGGVIYQGYTSHIFPPQNNGAFSSFSFIFSCFFCNVLAKSLLDVKNSRVSKPNFLSMVDEIISMNDE